jgi:hypothetical protein
MVSREACALDRDRHCTCALLSLELKYYTECEVAQGIALVGGAMILTFQSMQAYMVDTFTLFAASGRKLICRSTWSIFLTRYQQRLLLSLAYGHLRDLLSPYLLRRCIQDWAMGGV